MEIYGDMELNIKVSLGEVYINGEFVSQLCFTTDAIGSAVTRYLEDKYKEET